MVPEKVPVQWYDNHQIQPPHHQIDEREEFMMWLRGEFAAANAIIDALCHHLHAVGHPGEYDGVIGSVQQRRCNWNPILHMQQYFSVAEVVYSLQQVSWRRQQQPQQKAVGVEGTGRIRLGAKDFRGGVGGKTGGVEVHSLGEEVNGKVLINGYAKSNSNTNEKSEGGNKSKLEEKEENKVTETNGKFEARSVPTRQGIVTHEDDKTEVAGSCHVNGSKILRTFVATEICDGKQVNIAEGMKLYEDFFDDSEILKLTTLVNDLKTAGRRGQLKGEAFVTLKRPMRGHGRDIIQLGVPISDARPDDVAPAPVGSPKDLKIEPIPEVLHDVIERLLTEKVVGDRPDSAIIDFFNEGDYSHPHIWPQSFGRPVCVMFLTACEMSFGKVISIDHPGDYRGALQLSLSPGSILLFQGRSADYARHAISSLRKHRILITLVKSQPKKINATDVHRFPHKPAPPSPIRSANHIRPVTPKHFGPGHVGPPNNYIQPIFVPNHATPPAAFPASTGWPVGPPKHNPRPPHFLVPGTGFFLPSQSSTNSSNLTRSNGDMTTETTTAVGSEENGVKKSNDGHTLQDAGVRVAEQELNGSTIEGSAIAE